MSLFSFARKQLPLDDKERLNWLRLIRTSTIGPVTFYKLLETYGSAGEALVALPDIAAKSGRKKPLFIPDDKIIEKELRALDKLKARYVTAADNDYPLALAAIEDAPPVITVIGDLSIAQKNCVAIVGSRNASHNGRNFAEKIARELGQNDITVASGLARGIDTSAHKGSLKTGTIAVIAGGLDHIYPQENTDLFHDIAKNGLIIAENPIGTAPRAQDFPRRNRIVSGLCAGTVIVEANMRSGSLITARLAAEQGRDVYAVPGHPLDPRGEGTNKLIRDGAILARCADDIIEDLRNFTAGGLDDSAKRQYHFETVNTPDTDVVDSTPNETPEKTNDTDDIKTKLLRGLSFTPSMIDALIQQYGASAADMQIALIELEINGDIQRLPGNQIVRLHQDNPK